MRQTEPLLGISWKRFIRSMLLATGMVTLVQPTLAALEHLAETQIDSMDWRRSDALHFLPDPREQLFGAEHLTDWFEALDQLQNGASRHVSIVHFGGSHVQGGRMGQQFRARFSSDGLGDIAGRGLLSPLRLTGTNGPPGTAWASDSQWTSCRCAHRRHQCSWGLSGYNAQTDVGGSRIQLWAHTPQSGGYTVEDQDPSHLDCSTRIKIYHPPGSDPGWCFDGDEEPVISRVDTTLGVSTFELAYSADTLRFIAPDSPEKSQLYGIEIGSDRGGLVYHEIGANGASTASFLRGGTLFERQVAQLDPDLAILAWGINDAHIPGHRFNPVAFKLRYRELITRLRSERPGLPILLVTNNDSHYRQKTNPNGRKVQRAMFELSLELNVACFDLYSAMGGGGSMERWKALGLAKNDHLHFTSSGYALIANLYYDALMAAWVAYANETPNGDATP